MPDPVSVLRAHAVIAVRGHVFNLGGRVLAEGEDVHPRAVALLEREPVTHRRPYASAAERVDDDTQSIRPVHQPQAARAEVVLVGSVSSGEPATYVAGSPETVTALAGQG